MPAQQPRTLRPCPRSPNCVSSQADRADQEHFVEAIAFRGTLSQVVQVVLSWPRVQLVEETPDYLHFEQRSALFGFVDDLEIALGRGVLHVRSSSRSGYSDLGVNRRRVEALRSDLKGL